MKNFIALSCVLLLTAGLFAGCSKGSENNNGGATTPAPAETSTPAPAETSTPESAQTNTPEVKDEAHAWPRTYVDASGTEVVLTAKPKKIALLFFHHYEATLALNAPLYAATDLEAYTGWASLRPYSEKTELINLGATREPNLEKIVEVEPDLIIAAFGVHDAILDNLRKIAPTVAVSRAGDFSTWQGTLREYGKILGEEALAETRIADLEGLITEARSTLSAHSDKTVALARTLEKEVTYWLPDYLYNPEGGLGLASLLEMQEGVGAGNTISYEGFADSNPDYIFLYEDALDESDETVWKRLEDDALWQSMSAVKNGQVYILDRSAFSGGPLAMELGVKTILEAMTSSK